MIVNVELTQSGVEKFNKFFAANAKPEISMQTVLLEALSTLEDRAGMNESYVYELGRAYTITGNPELLILAADDVSVQTEDDE